MEQIFGFLQSLSTPVLILIVAVAAVLVFSGKLRFKTSFLSVGNSANRALLLKQFDFCERQVGNGAAVLMALMKDKGFDMDFYRTMYVFSKVLSQLHSWLLVNHISNDDAYVSDKVQEIMSVVSAELSTTNFALRTNNDYMSALTEFTQEFTKTTIAGLVRLKELEK